MQRKAALWALAACSALALAGATASAEMDPATFDTCDTFRTEFPIDDKIAACTKLLGTTLTADERLKVLDSRAVNYLVKPDAAAAIADFGAILGFDPGNGRGLAGRGSAYFGVPDYPAATRDYDEYVRRFGTTGEYSALAYAMRGEIKRLTGDDAGALTELGQALAINGYYADALMSRSLIYTAQDKLDLALADADKLIEAEPGLPRGLHQRGVIHYWKQDYDTAIANFDAALAADAEWTDAHYMRGLSYEAKDDTSRALVEYDEVIRKAPDFPDVYRNRGSVLSDLGAYDRALADYDKAIALAPDWSGAYNSRCWHRAVAGRDLPAALADCDKALDLFPDTAAYHDSRALVLLKQGDALKALEDYKAAVAGEPGRGIYLYGMGVALNRLGRNAEGDAALVKARQLDSGVDAEFASFGIIP